MPSSKKGEKMANCMGWEKLPHAVPEKDLMVVGQRTFLCPECHKRFQEDPGRDEYVKSL